MLEIYFRQDHDISSRFAKSLNEHALSMLIYSNNIDTHKAMSDISGNRNALPASGSQLKPML
jgi:hypothetical protein